MAWMLTACAPIAPQPPDTSAAASALRMSKRPSPNYDARRANFVVIHHTSAATAQQSLAVLTDPARRVSSHYLIGRDGTIFHLVDEGARAWHAGDSYWGGQRDMNSASIGIELDNDGFEPFAGAQIDTLLALLADVKTRHNIPAANFIGHADIAPGRKVDPSALFPWRRLAQSGFGLWCDPPYPLPPQGLDTDTLLQALGYNVWNIDAAISAFKLHFVPDDPSPGMTDRDRSILYCLVMEKRARAAE
jgi:N-acetylmuramoyl-L-alanine amidase